MNNSIENSPSGAPRNQSDLDFIREMWKKAGEAAAAELTRKTGIEHTAADALQPHAEKYNELIELFQKNPTLSKEELERRIRIITGAHSRQ